MDIKYNTLHKDINLVERDNGYWDWETKIGDINITVGKQSLRNGLIIACLTSWNYLNRQGNPTYETFGNHAYEELKKKKSSIVKYKIEQYFIEVLNRMRRVENVETLKVHDNPKDPNDYLVEFTVISTNDEIVNGRFQLTTNTQKSSAYLKVTHPYTTSTPTNPTTFTITLTSEYGVPIEGELIYIQDKEENNLGVIGPTDSTGTSTWKQYPFNRIGYQNITFTFQGNTLFNGTANEDNQFLSIPFYFDHDYETDELYIIKNEGYEANIWLGEIVTSVDEITYNPNKPNKCFMIKQENDTYRKYYYTNGELTTEDDVYGMINEPDDLEPYQIRLFVEEIDNQLYIVEDNVMITL